LESDRNLFVAAYLLLNCVFSINKKKENDKLIKICGGK
jgi:hypothetical protein